MRTSRKRTNKRTGRRAAPKKALSIIAPKEFLRRTFYYLKSEQFLKVSRRLLCEAA